jgi:phage terminase large subunit
VSYESALRQAGYSVEVIPNQGRGAAMARIESARRLFGSIWFNEATTAAGIEALGWYHEKKDDVRIIGLGPEHDWSSHAADAFGLVCITAENGFRSSRPMGFKRKGSAMAVWDENHHRSSIAYFRLPLPLIKELRLTRFAQCAAIKPPE